MKAILIILLFICSSASAQFPVAGASIVVDEHDVKLVRKVAELFQNDIEMLTGKKPVLTHQLTPGNIILIGSLDSSSFIKKLKLDVSRIKGKWEAYQMQVVKNPFPGVPQALVIVGSDRRGTAYGVLELSKKLGVSPWYWWADVPVEKKTALYVQNTIVTDAPAVKYRGIFINDEAPALSGWSKEKFGGFNHLFYEKVFELILRLKGNYLWPAMWGNAFYDDDVQNMQTADDYGIVIGTSHHEPLMRAHDEWRRYGQGKWNYDSNEVRLKDFWRTGMQRTGNTEKIVSIGMRGDGDEPMTQGTAIALLERIVSDQRKIIEAVTHKPAGETPQLWALYKEVQDYYDKGMRVPDDVTLLLCDDNWGNIRKLPKLDEKPRKGGYGIYYHFDYVGGPRNYKWINTNPIPRVWEQMHLAWEYNARQIWIVNVGDIKPMEFPISFFLDYAWAPERIRQNDLQKYTEQWAAQQFGIQHAKKIAQIISAYLKYIGRRKPELLDANTYNYSEFQEITTQYSELLNETQLINDRLPEKYRDAYFQLVLHPVKAAAYLHSMYYMVAMNKKLAANNNPRANSYADRAKELYVDDSLLSLKYNKEISGGKWNHMMDQTHIGYTYWQQPPNNVMPKVVYVTDSTNMIVDPLAEKPSGVSVEADHFNKAINTNGITWTILPDHGKTGSAVTPFPVTAPAQTPGNNAPHLEYEFNATDTGSCKINLYFSPTLNFHNTPEGLQYAISIDNEQPQIISINKEERSMKIWESWVANNIIIKTSSHHIAKPGKHVLKYWMVNPAVVLQKLVIDFGGVKPTSAQVKLPRLVRDSMVLQRDAKINLWGWASPKEKINIRFNNKNFSTTTGEDGKWLIALPAMKAGGPYTMNINNIVLKDILIGDVWFCSGQSNMVHQMELHKDRYKQDIADANYPEIRHFFIPTLTDLQSPHDDLPTGYWKTANSQDVRQFSAVAYFFAKTLYEKYHVPIGLINASVGGTPIEAWTSEEGLNQFSSVINTIQKNKDTAYVNGISRAAAASNANRPKPQDKGMLGPVKWYDTAYVPKNWYSINIPGYWEDQGVGGLDGIVWYRKEINVPVSMTGIPARILMGRIVDADVVYINGVQVGNTTYMYPQRRYNIPANLLKPGKNIIVVRVTNNAGKGGFVPDKPYYLEAGDQTLDLKGEWQYKVGDAFAPYAAVNAIAFQNQPAALFNAMVSPVINYTIKGFLWYQGESNIQNAAQYEKLLPALIADWRKQWKQGTLPFLYVQLPNYLDVQYLPIESQWALVREGQLKTLSVANTGMAVAIDLGEWNDVHPDNKKDVGVRLALAAEKVAYNENNVVHSGPIYQSFTKESNKIILSFTNTGSGLTTNDGESPVWFAIAGTDKKFIWANAKIEGDKVIVWNDNIPDPRYVRYAWADNPRGANLYNKEGLPASPFRTD